MLLVAVMLGVGSSAWATPTQVLSFSRKGATNSYTNGFTFSSVAEGKTDGMDAGEIASIQKRIETMDFKKQLLNIPCFVPSIRK